MSNTWDLQQYVEAHPDNHEQRWRLTKRLYKDGEFRAALEHLQVLSNEWDKKPSVIRYHAATLTRLKRPKEAVKVLEEASREWPKDADLLEQLAMAYTRAGNLEDAASIWGDIASMVPTHSYARRAQDKLLKEIRPGRSQGDPSESNDIVPCSRCGTMNSLDVFSCKNCNQRLDLFDDGNATPDDTPIPASRSVEIVPWLKRGLLVVSLLFCLYAVNAALDSRNAVSEDNHGVYISWDELVAMELLMPHLVVGLVLLVVWPLILRGAEVSAGVGGWFSIDTALTGATWALFAFAVSWIPGVSLMGWCLAVVGVTLAGTWLEFRDRPMMGVRVWIVEISLVTLVLLIGIAAVIGPGFIGQMPEVDAFSRMDRTSSELQITGTIKEPRVFRTQSSQSDWIDERGAGLALKLTVPGEALDRELTFKVVQNGQTLLYEHIVAQEHYFDIETMQPDIDVTVELVDGGDVPVTLEMRGVLPIKEL